MPFLWLALIVAFIIVEACTYQLVCIWFAIGSIGGLFTSMATDNVLIQAAVFTFLSALMLICLRPAVSRVLKPKGLKTNIDGLIGKKIMITKDVSNADEKGEGKVNGLIWSVRSADNEPILKGTCAVIEKVEGVTLIVKEGEK